MGQINAPEKIYMTPSFGEPDNVLLASFSKSHLDFHRDIEYTQTNAFIEKAVEWIKENITNNPNANSVLVRNGCVTFGMLVEDFKKYMND
jgi:hypothetical protein